MKRERKNVLLPTRNIQTKGNLEVAYENDRTQELFNKQG